MVLEAFLPQRVAPRLASGETGPDASARLLMSGSGVDHAASSAYEAAREVTAKAKGRNGS
jgi:hypothetical protein